MMNTMNETDTEESLVLFAAMVKVVGRLDGLFERGKAALEALAAAAPDNEQDWDGVVWYERLNAYHDGSLAERLTQAGDPKEIALEWLKTKY